MTHEKPTVIDLFAGIGGFSLAFEREGFETIAFSETDPYATAVLKKHWPHVKNYGDIRNIKGLRADVVVGGPPYQPSSLAGKRRGTADHRWLWPEALRVLFESGASWAVFENPPGILSLQQGLVFEHLLLALEDQGYTVQPIIVPACAVDAPHRRDRVWIVGHNDKLRQRSQSTEGQGRKPDDASRPEVGECGEALAHSLSPRLEERQEQSAWEEQQTVERSGNTVSNSGCWNGEGPGRGVSRGQEPFRWQPEPAVGRVAHGIPARVDRLKCLGNSIVPQVAQVFAQAIYQALTSPCPQHANDH